MKVILTEDVKNLGKKGEIVEVSDSYARNVLIRGKKGLEATGKNLNDLKLRKQMTIKLLQRILKMRKHSQGSWRKPL